MHVTKRNKILMDFLVKKAALPAAYRNTATQG